MSENQTQHEGFSSKTEQRQFYRNKYKFNLKALKLRPKKARQWALRSIRAIQEAAIADRV